MRMHYSLLWAHCELQGGPKQAARSTDPSLVLAILKADKELAVGSDVNYLHIFSSLQNKPWAIQMGNAVDVGTRPV